MSGYVGSVHLLLAFGRKEGYKSSSGSAYGGIRLFSQDDFS